MIMIQGLTSNLSVVTGLDVRKDTNMQLNNIQVISYSLLLQSWRVFAFILCHMLIRIIAVHTMRQSKEQRPYYIIYRMLTFNDERYTAVQSQKAVSAYFTSKQILPFGFATCGV